MARSDSESAGNNATWYTYSWAGGGGGGGGVVVLCLWFTEDMKSTPIKSIHNISYNLARVAEGHLHRTH